MLIMGFVSIGLSIFLGLLLNHHIVVKKTNDAGVVEVNGFNGYLGHLFQLLLANTIVALIFIFGSLSLLRGYVPSVDRLMSDSGFITEASNDLPGVSLYFKIHHLLIDGSTHRADALTHFIIHSSPTFYVNYTSQEIDPWIDYQLAGRCVALRGFGRNNRVSFRQEWFPGGTKKLYISKDDVRAIPNKSRCNGDPSRINFDKLDLRKRTVTTFAPTHFVKSAKAQIRKGPHENYSNAGTGDLATGDCVEIIRRVNSRWVEVQYLSKNRTRTGFMRGSPVVIQPISAETEC